jgi:hypothetical protein
MTTGERGHSRREEQQMPSYRIVCVNTEHPHRNIVAVRTSWGRSSTVEEVRKALANGDRFYTVSSTGAPSVFHTQDLPCPRR